MHSSKLIDSAKVGRPCSFHKIYHTLISGKKKTNSSKCSLLNSIQDADRLRKPLLIFFKKRSRSYLYFFLNSSLSLLVLLEGNDCPDQTVQRGVSLSVYSIRVVFAWRFTNPLCAKYNCSRHFIIFFSEKIRLGISSESYV